jgi:hypothetical protein
MAPPDHALPPSHSFSQDGSLTRSPPSVKKSELQTGMAGGNSILIKRAKSA